MDLIPRKFRFWQFAGDEDSSSARIHLFGVPIGLIERKDEDLLKHLDHVVVGVVVIVEQHDAIERR